jgi:antitoxin CptB
MKKQDTGYGIQDTGAKNGELPQVSHPESRILDPALLQRVRWRSRRGLLELDIVLGRFIESHYMQLDEKEKQVFEVLLDMPDNPLWDMIAGRQEATLMEQRALLEKIRAV